MKINFKLIPVAFAGVIALSNFVASPAVARIEDQISLRPTHAQRDSGNGLSSVSIRGNSGGMIGSFALQAAKYRGSGTLVKFSGRCDSACTLFLGLPKSQMCISRGAYFRFHAPTHPSAHAASVAKKYMMRKYPGWVKNWIGNRKGLTQRLITMDYQYASRFIRTCSV